MICPRHRGAGRFELRSSSFLPDSVASAAHKQLRAARPTTPCVMLPRSRLPASAATTGTQWPDQLSERRRRQQWRVRRRRSSFRFQKLTISGNCMLSRTSSVSEPGRAECDLSVERRRENVLFINARAHTHPHTPTPQTQTHMQMA